MRDLSATLDRSQIPVLLLLITAAPLLAQEEPTPEVEIERLLAEAARLVELDQLPEVLSFLDDIVELEALHPDLELPRLFWAKPRHRGKVRAQGGESHRLRCGGLLPRPQTPTSGASRWID